MPFVFANRAKKTTSLVIVLGIVGLTLVSLLPWISVTETFPEGVTKTTYHDIASMENNDDNQIQSLAGDVRLLNICFWMLIVFGLLSFVGMILLASGKQSHLAQIIVFIGCANVIFSILVVHLVLNLLQNIEGMATISLAPILGLSFIPIDYAHLILITGFTALIGSVSYAGLTVFFSIKRYKEQKKQQYDQKTMQKELYTKTKNEPPITKKPSLEKKKEIARRMQPLEKRFEPEEKTPLKTAIRKEYYADLEREKTLEPEKTTTLQQPAAPFVIEKIPEKSPEVKKEIYEKPVEEERSPEPEITSETAQEDSSESDEILMSPLFEKALSSALEKIQPEIKKEKVEQKQPEQKPANEKISVRCSECKNVFTAEKGEYETKIECPKCGRKGVIKQ